jgi:hypothetical protein
VERRIDFYQKTFSFVDRFLDVCSDAGRQKMLQQMRMDELGICKLLHLEAHMTT